MKSVWQMLPKPFFVLAPMEDVTDTVFRQIVGSCASPDLFMTEFTNCDGLQSAGRKAVIHRLKYADNEHPIIAQVWGIHPEAFFKTAQEVIAMGFDGIDINMGCPEKSVIGHGACAALIENPHLAKEIIDAVKKGVQNNIPVSVKTRIGFSHIETESWIPLLLSTGIDALTVHGRTAAEMSKVPCHWDEIGRAVTIRNDMGVSTLIIGNGDVQNAADGRAKASRYGVDGVMMGRAVFEDLWAFDRSQTAGSHTPHQYLGIMKRHVELFERTWGDAKQYAILRKFFKIYVRGFDGASEWRARVMETKTPGEVYPIIDEMLQIVR